MKWYKITISTTIHATDLITAMLYDMGISGVELINNVPITEEEKKKMFVDILPEVIGDDKTAQLIFYLEKDNNIQKVLHDVKSGIDKLRSFVEIGSGSIDVTVTKDEDWANEWKKYFEPFRVSDNIIIKPTWRTLSGKDEAKEDDIIVEIDPGMAFGTGTHETTQLPIKQLTKHLKAGQKVLDIGCGSGILSIISNKLGARSVIGIDIDGNAVNIAKENIEINDISQEEVTILFANILNAEDRKELDKTLDHNYDIVVANILTEVIIELSEHVGKYLRPEGYFISSGILYTQSDKVQEAICKNGMEIVEVNVNGDWVCITARKK